MFIYLFIYSDRFGDRDTVLNLIKSIPQISHWRYDLPNTFYLASNTAARPLGDIFREKKPGIRFLLVDITDQPRTGWLPNDTWVFLRKWAAQE